MPGYYPSRKMPWDLESPIAEQLLQAALAQKEKAGPQQPMLGVDTPEAMGPTGVTGMTGFLGLSGPSGPQLPISNEQVQEMGQNAIANSAEAEKLAPPPGRGMNRTRGGSTKNDVEAKQFSTRATFLNNDDEGWSPVLDEKGKPIIKDGIPAMEYHTGGYTKLLNSLNQAPWIKDQKDSLGDLQDRMDLFTQMAPTTPSWIKPALAAVDSMTGSKLLAGYEPGMSPEEKTGIALKYADEIQKRKMDISKTTADLIGKLKSGTDINQVLQKVIAEGGFKDAQPSNNGSTTAGNQWMTQTRQMFADSDKESSQIGKLLVEVASGNPINDNRISVLRATADAHGRPNIAEVKTEAGAKDVVSRASQALSFLTSGKLTDSNRRMILQSLRDIQSYDQKRRDFLVERARGTGKQIYNLTDAQINSNITPSYANSSTPSETGEIVTVKNPKTGAVRKAAKMNLPKLKSLGWEEVK